MTDLAGLLVDPINDYSFMRRALVAGFALALACGPVGVMLMLRRMSLVGDAMAHAVLPGAAIGFLIGGLSLTAMTLGGAITGVVVAVLAGVMARLTPLREDATFAGFYLISLALGVLLISTGGSSVDLVHILFGTILAIDRESLFLVAGLSSLTVLALATFYRHLVAEAFDPNFLLSVKGAGGVVHVLFLALVVVNLVAAFQALGTLMAVGLMMLPALASRFWVRQVWSLFAVAAGVAFVSAYAGLILSFHLDLPTGPAIVLFAGVVYLLSAVIGPYGGLITRQWRTASSAA
ncbi:metal ABC transporter permease [Fodinicurvata sp. EGI_FJ10296]|uniref:metal ABC transporter permease n=1 Tax=Fodinicurvata sp. EGI_FJ10296 TaxID=3231908 RepID=UPI0034528A16